MGHKFYLQATKEINQETEKLDTSVSNNKEIIHSFPILANKYGWGLLEFIVGTYTGANKILEQ